MEQENNRPGKKRGRSGDNIGLVWGGTVLVAFAIVGFCVYVATNNRTAPQNVPPVSTAPVAQGNVPAPAIIEAPLKQSDVNPEPEPVIAPEPEAEPEPSVVEEAGPPRLKLDNLAGTTNLEVPFLSIRNKVPLEHTCFRNNISPEMSWSGAPSKTKSYVVFMEKRNKGDDDAFLSWALFNIPAGTKHLAINQPKIAKLENGARHANSDHNNIGYIGPCDSKGKFTYALRVFALDTVLDLEPGVHKYELIRAMNGHIIDAAEQEFIHYYRL